MSNVKICPKCRKKYSLAFFKRFDSRECWKHALCDCGYEGYLYDEIEWPEQHVKRLKGQIDFLIDIAAAQSVGKQSALSALTRQDIRALQDELLSLGSMGVPERKAVGVFDKY